MFVGGGVIALEFGHVYARAGAKVTILEVLPQLLPALDADAVEQVRKESERIGIVVHTGVKVKRVERASKRLAHRVRASTARSMSSKRPRGQRRRPHRQCRSARSRRRATSRMKASASRSTRSALDLQPVGPCLRRRAVRLRRSCRRSPPMKGGWSAATSSRDPSTGPTMRSMPTSVYTVPALATVGLSEAKAKEQGPEDARSGQRHGVLVLGPHLCRDRGLVEDHRR